MAERPAHVRRCGAGGACHRAGRRCSGAPQVTSFGLGPSGIGPAAFGHAPSCGTGRRLPVTSLFHAQTRTLSHRRCRDRSGIPRCCALCLAGPPGATRRGVHGQLHDSRTGNRLWCLQATSSLWQNCLRAALTECVNESASSGESTMERSNFPTRAPRSAIRGPRSGAMRAAERRRGCWRGPGGRAASRRRAVAA